MCFHVRGDGVPKMRSPRCSFVVYKLYNASYELLIILRVFVSWA